MIWDGGLLLFLILAIDSCFGDYLNHFAVEIQGGQNEANRVARETGFINKGLIGSLEDTYFFELPNRHKRSADPSHSHHEILTSHKNVAWFEQQKVLTRKKRDFKPRDVASQMSVLDPYWKNQWYMRQGGRGGYDMNVMAAWQQGVTGKGVVIAILDDGLERDHPDLERNYDPYASYDLNDHDRDPMPRYDPSNENRHGTRCAGEVSAEANNTACTIGVAPDSRIGGIRMLDGEVYDAVEAASLSYNRSHIDIYSASWGPDDDGKVVDGPGKLAKKAFIDGVAKGRGGKGSIFVWASGNGGSAHDSCNCDGYANSIFTLSISSTSENGRKPWYLEECSSTLATTYSSGAYNERQIASTDLRKQCTTSHTGTSASAPLAAGVIALVLEANPNLTWRDMQYITLMTSRPEPINDGEWIVNGVGRKVSLRYGYGLMDAAAMVSLARKWTNVPEKHVCSIPSTLRNGRVTGTAPLTSQVTTDGCSGSGQQVKYLEHVQAKVTINHNARGRLIIFLTSPRGTRSKVLPARSNDYMPGKFTDWPLLSVQFWGEDPSGTWTLEVQESNNYGRGGSPGGVLESWSLVLHGTAADPVGHQGNQPVPTVPLPTTTLHAAVSQNCHMQCAGGCSGPSATDCSRCRSLTVTGTGECVSACPTSHYVQDTTCQPCAESCLTCNGPALTECLSCRPGHTFHTISNKHRICNNDCPEGTFRNGSDKDCKTKNGMSSAMSDSNLGQLGQRPNDFGQGSDSSRTNCSLLMLCTCLNTFFAILYTVHL